MESQWLTGGRKPAQSVWRSERSQGVKIGTALFIICPIVAAFVPGTGAGVWIVRILIALAIPILVTLLWNRIEEPTIHVPNVLVGVNAADFHTVLLTRAEQESDYSSDKYMLSKLSIILWTRGTHGSFEWPLQDGDMLAVGRFEVDDGRIRLAHIRPVDDKVVELVTKYPDLFDQTFPHPTLAVDSDGRWILFDPDGRLLNSTPDADENHHRMPL